MNLTFHLQGKAFTCKLFSPPPALHACLPVAVSDPPCVDSGDPAAPSAQPAELSGPPAAAGASSGPELLPRVSCEFDHHVLAKPWPMKVFRQETFL